MCIRHRITRTPHGFTLVELLVVISIIAVLLAVLVPAMNKAREQSKRLICRTKLKQIGYAINLYAENNNNFMPGAMEVWIPRYGRFAYYWHETIGPYLSESASWRTEDGKLIPQEIYRCPSVSRGDTSKHFSYAMNEYMGWRDRNIMDNSYITVNVSNIKSLAGVSMSVKVTRPYCSPKRIMQITTPSEKLVLVDSIVKEGINSIGSKPASVVNDIKYPEYENFYGTIDFTRHRGVTNTIFADFHVDEFRNSIPSYNFAAIGKTTRPR